MSHLDHSLIEAELVKLVDEVNRNVSKIAIDIDRDCCPGNIGISSQILITIMGRVGYILEIDIPDDCYIFYDRKTNRQLNIREATQKLINKVQNGK